MKRRGQFFIVAALIIAGIILSLGAVYTLSQSTREDVRIYSLSDEINYETHQVIDSSVLNSLSQEEINKRIKDLTSNYSRLYPDSEILVIFGDGDNLYFRCVDSGQVGTVGASVRSCIKRSEPLEDSLIDFNLENKKVIVNLEGQNYTFDIKEGQMFNMIIRKEKSRGEVTITKSGNDEALVNE